MVAALAPAEGHLTSRPKVRGVAALLVAALFAVLVACGSDDGDEETSSPGAASPTVSVGSGAVPAAPSRPVCDMLTRDEVVAALGNPVKDPVPVGDQGCTWATDVDGGTSLDVTAVKPGKEGIAFQCRSLRRGQNQQANREPVDGLGNEALWVWENLAAPIVQGSLVACWDESAVSVLLTGEKDQGALRQTAVDLAKKVQSQL